MSRAFVKDDDEERPEPKLPPRETELPPPSSSSNAVGYGASVRVRDAAGAMRTYTIVGEDNDDPANGRIAWTSPLGEALMDRVAGETVTWRRPIGDTTLRIEEIAYDATGKS